VSGILGVEPPTVQDYLFSANNCLLIPIPGNNNIEEDLVDWDAVAQGNPTYYHVL